MEDGKGLPEDDIENETFSTRYIRRPLQIFSGYSHKDNKYCYTGNTHYYSRKALYEVVSGLRTFTVLS